MAAINFARSPRRPSTVDVSISIFFSCAWSCCCTAEPPPNRGAAAVVILLAPPPLPPLASPPPSRFDSSRGGEATGDRCTRYARANCSNSPMSIVPDPSTSKFRKNDWSSRRKAASLSLAALSSSPSSSSSLRSWPAITCSSVRVTGEGRGGGALGGKIATHYLGEWW